MISPDSDPNLKFQTFMLDSILHDKTPIDPEPFLGGVPLTTIDRSIVLLQCCNDHRFVNDLINPYL